MTPARIATVVVVAAMVSFGSVASARHEPVNDPKDTRGRLDVAAVRLRHDEGPPQWRVVTFGEWTVAQMWDVGYVVVELDTRADAAIDFRAVMRSDGRRLVATLYRVRRDGSMR
ncbi:MAG TPA: hypothetical protein VLA90_11075, partial [Actinomycetota bacterium]|nr:hypothetical protein [Actinomycetota bacterium]